GALAKAVGVVAQHDARAPPRHQAGEFELEPAQRHRPREQEMALREDQLLAQIDDRQLLPVGEHRLEGGSAQRLQRRFQACRNCWVRAGNGLGLLPPPLWGRGGEGGGAVLLHSCLAQRPPPRALTRATLPTRGRVKTAIAARLSINTLVGGLTSPVAASSARPCPRRDRSARA